MTTALVCRRCNHALPPEAFWRDAHSRRGGRSYTCKECKNDQRRERMKNPETRRKVSIAACKWHQDPKNREKYRRAIWNWALKSKYGMTLGDYERMLEDQGGGCAICGSPESFFKKDYMGRSRLAVDHDHACCPNKKACGKCIRGLLCQPCNSVLGRMHDSPELLRAAADYLEAHARKT